jgi:hypothetical protein
MGQRWEEISELVSISERKTGEGKKTHWLNAEAFSS